MDEEVSIYVSISISNPSMSKTSHEERFFQLLNEYNSKPRSRRGVKLPMDETGVDQASNKSNVTPSKKRGKKDRSKYDSPSNAKRQKKKTPPPPPNKEMSVITSDPSSRMQDIMIT